MKNPLRSIGPGALAAAAFIGPGTVTTATIAGAQYGYALIWALAFATIAAIILQEMAARLGVTAGLGLGEALLAIFKNTSAVRWPLTVLILSALFVGNAAYEGGNIAGAALGLNAAAPGFFSGAWAVLPIIFLAGALLAFGGYRVIERVLIAIVILMSMAFLGALIIVRPEIGAMLTGLVGLEIPAGAGMLAVGLIGTTIVPYNLFLHASAARNRWPSGQTNPNNLGEARTDTVLSIGLGGLISILILSTAAASLFSLGLEVSNAGDMARQLEPAFGPASKYLLAAGLFAAGLSSAVTAPLATAYATSELFGWESDPKNARFRLIALVILTIGAATALSGAKPINIILFAQFANGLLLPIIASFLLYAVNKRSILGDQVNRLSLNIAGAIVILITAGLGLRALLRVFGVLA